MTTPRHPRIDLKRWITITAAIATVSLVVLAGAAVTTGVTNVVSIFEERHLVSMLRSQADYDDLVSWLSLVHADWHQGESFTHGEAYTAFNHEALCTSECGTTVQAAFDHRYWICEIVGDVVTMVFDRNGRLSAWSVSEAADGC